MQKPIVEKVLYRYDRSGGLDNIHFCIKNYGWDEKYNFSNTEYCGYTADECMSRFEASTAGTVDCGIFEYLMDNGNGTILVTANGHVPCNLSSPHTKDSLWIPDMAKSKKSGCFLTTACVEFAGMADDCEILTLMRQLRDEYVTKLPEGEKLISEYYEISPKIVAAIKQLPDSEASAHFDGMMQKLKMIASEVKCGNYYWAKENYYLMYQRLLVSVLPYGKVTRWHQ